MTHFHMDDGNGKKKNEMWNWNTNEWELVGERKKNKKEAREM